MIGSVSLSASMDLIASVLGGDAESVLLAHMKRGALQAIAETLVVRCDTVIGEDTGHSRSVRTEFSRQHNVALDPGFWIEAAREKTINWKASEAAFSSRWFQGEASPVPDGSHTYVRVATGIHVRLADLRQHFDLVAADPPAKIELAAGQYLSPFLSMMIDATQRFEITAENVPLKKELEFHFQQQRLPDGTSVSARTASAMATLCRPPEAMEGGKRG